MPAFETYRAFADGSIARAVANTAPFSIEVRFGQGLTERYKDAFKLAADRWCRIIVADLPDVEIDGEVIDDVLILAEGVEIDGTRGILGQAGPTHLRPAGADRAAFLPARGIMAFDTADLAQMEAGGTLNDVIAHEMGHVLGIGTLWRDRALLRGARGPNPVFVGPHAMAAYGGLTGGAPAPVPVANTGGAGTRDAHWREADFGHELMSGFIAATGNPISRVTAASLEDLGYVVNLDAAEPYSLPSAAFTPSSSFAVHAGHAHAGHDGHRMTRPPRPVVLPDASLG